MKDEFRKSYLATDYLVDELNLKINVGNRHPDLDEFCKRSGVESWAYLTAWNPKSMQVSEEMNLLYNLNLQRALKDYEFYSGLGLSQNEDWPGEESFLILGLSKVHAMNLAQRFNQNAFVYGRVDDSAQLVWTY